MLKHWIFLKALGYEIFSHFLIGLEMINLESFLLNLEHLRIISIILDFFSSTTITII